MTSLLCPACGAKSPLDKYNPLPRCRECGAAVHRTAERRPVTSRRVEHRIMADGRCVFSAEIPDFSWEAKVRDLEEQGAAVVVERGRGRHARVVYPPRKGTR